MTSLRADLLAGLASAHPELFTLAEALERQGVRVHLVGGPVRDTLSGMIPNDLDVTSAATPDEFRAAMTRAADTGAFHGYTISVYDVGEAHGTTGVAITTADGARSVIEHTTHRREVYAEHSRSPEVSFGESLTEDLARRDFTVNAIAVDLITGDLCDPYGGVEDLEAGLLRCCDTPEVTFSEDPLRIARLVRFAAQRGYRIDDATGHAAACVADRLEIVSMERRRDELIKMARDGTTLAEAIRVATSLGIDDHIFGLGDFFIDGTDITFTVDCDALAEADCDHPLYGIAVLAHASDDASVWARRWKFNRATIKRVGRISTAITSVSAGTLAEVALRSTGSVADAQLAAAVATATRSPAAGVLRHAALDAEVICAPLTVGGDDALAAGLTGEAIGTALAELNRRHALRGGLDRATALAELAELARRS